MYRKGIILAGGRGTRLYPLTKGTSKQLLPVYKQPLVYYPLATLIDAGIKEVAVIVAKGEKSRFEQTLGDGSQWGISITYFIQEVPKGIAEAFIIAKEWLQNSGVVLVLGDNIFYGESFSEELNKLGNLHRNIIFAYEVSNPSDYGVVQFEKIDTNRLKAVSIIEKPIQYISNYAVPGLYFYDETCIEKALSLKPSTRGELEITDLNNLYIKEQSLNVKIILNTAWLDTGNPDSLLDAGEFVRVMERRTGIEIGPSRSAKKRGLI